MGNDMIVLYSFVIQIAFTMKSNLLTVKMILSKILTVSNITSLFHKLKLSG